MDTKRRHRAKRIRVVSGVRAGRRAMTRVASLAQQSARICWEQRWCWPPALTAPLPTVPFSSPLCASSAEGGVGGSAEIYASSCAAWATQWLVIGTRGAREAPFPATSRS